MPLPAEGQRKNSQSQDDDISTDLRAPPRTPSPGGILQEKRGVLLKEETELLGMRKKWTKKLVVCDGMFLKYYANDKPEFERGEQPRKTLPVHELIISKLPVASRHFRDHSFRVTHKDYTITFSAESDSERDGWMLFMETAGGGRNKRFDSNIERQIMIIKEVGHPWPRSQSPKPPSSHVGDEHFPKETSAATANRRMFASMVYDLFIKDGNPAVLTKDIEELVLHEGIDTESSTSDILAIVDPADSGYIAKDLFLNWCLMEDQNSKSANGAQTLGVPSRPASTSPLPMEVKPSDGGSSIGRSTGSNTISNTGSSTGSSAGSNSSNNRKNSASPSALCPSAPTLDVDKVTNLLKFSNKPRSIYMLESTLCSSINVAIRNENFARPEEAIRIIGPIMDLIKTIWDASVETDAQWETIKSAMSAEFDQRDSFDGDDTAYGEVKDNPLNRLLALLVRFLKHCIKNQKAADKVFSTTSDTRLYWKLAALLEKTPGDANNKIRATTAKLFLHAAASFHSAIPAYNIRGIVAIAATHGDNLRPTCLEILRLLIPTRTKTVSQCECIV